jgi:hypothetical protein
MRNHIFIICISFIAIIFVSSCSKSNNSPINGVDVYVSGMYKSDAVYWKNNNMVTLGHTDYAPGNVFIDGNDIYMPATIIESDLSPHVIYWKNGAMTDLGQGIATGIVVVGNDVYVAGTTYDKNGISYVACWKNGALTNYGQRTVDQIVASGNDIYIAGSIPGGASSAYDAVYWKNGAPIDLGYGYLTSIAVSGSDVYTAGITYINRNQVTGYWKNGTFTTLGDGYAFISGITVSGGTVYCAGYDVNQGKKGVYWKNTTPIPVAAASELADVAVDGNNIFLSGNYQQGVSGIGTIAESSLLIENSSVFTLASGTQLNEITTSAFSVVVVNK